MSAAEQTCYTFISAAPFTEPPKEALLRECLENGDTKTKIRALKQVIHLILNGESFPTILIPIIRYVLPLENHTIKKLLLIFWEVVPMTTSDGRLLEEMILVCDFFRKDLLHSNEYIRGSTLRFLCKLKESELLEPLMSPIRKCLEHRHAYVRKNAVFAIFTIYKKFNFLIPDAPELIANFLQTEVDMVCKGNAFVTLMHIDQDMSLNYLNSCIDQVHTFGTSMQLAIVELIYKICYTDSAKGFGFISCIYNLLNSSSPSVRYEAAGVLVALSSAPAAVKAATNCYIELIVSGNDNNVKLIVLDRLIALRGIPAHEKVLQDLVMDILQVLTPSDLEVCRKTLDLARDLVSLQNVENVVSVLKKEVAKTHNTVEYEDAGKYRQLLVAVLHSCCIRFPYAARTVIPILVEFLSDSDVHAVADILFFIREAALRFEHLRTLILYELLQVFSSIKLPEIHRSVLWIVGECCSTVEDIQMAMTEFQDCIGSIPFVRELKDDVVNEEKVIDAAAVPKSVVDDGTYSTSIKKRTPLRSYLMDGNYFIGASLSSTLVKLAFRYVALVPDLKKQNLFTAKSMLIMASIMHLGKSGLTSSINDDDFERVALCLKALADHCPFSAECFGGRPCKFINTLSADRVGELENQKTKRKEKVSYVDDPITFGQLASTSSTSRTEDIFELSLSQARDVVKKDSTDDLTFTKLSKVTQLTGISDPVYAEAYVHTDQDDIILDILVVNQTQDTLQNFTLEFATSDNLKLVEEPPPFTLAPLKFCSVKANVKVVSSVGGVIFGNLTYNVNISTDERNVVLNDIHIDILNCILPATCSQKEFFSMWQKFTWENKMSVKTHILDHNEFLMFVTRATNMKCLTPEQMLSGECEFLAANLYGRSIFEECIVANVFIERDPLVPGTPVTGHVRIRADSKTLVLGLKDKITSAQKSSYLKIGG